mgnify:CR=1 FL=1
MKTKGSLVLNGHIYELEGTKLFNVAFNRTEVNASLYFYVNSYGLRKYDAVIIGEHFYWIVDGEFKEAAVFKFAGSENTSFCRTAFEGKDNFVFQVENATQKTFLLGRSFEEIAEGVYKIGKQVFQTAPNGDLEFMQKCENFEVWQNLLEIWIGEPDFSDLYVYQKTGSRWQFKQHILPGNVRQTMLKKAMSAKR